MAGVSLVADAAEELERNTVNADARMLSPSSSNACTVDGTISYHCFVLPIFTTLCFYAFLTINGWVLMFYSTLVGLGTNHIKEADQQAPAKLKLQLFPINEATRKALEKVNMSLCC